MGNPLFFFFGISYISLCLKSCVDILTMFCPFSISSTAVHVHLRTKQKINNQLTSSGKILQSQFAACCPAGRDIVAWTFLFLGTMTSSKACLVIRCHAAAGVDRMLGCWRTVISEPGSRLASCPASGADVVSKKFVSVLYTEWAFITWRTRKG